MTPAGPRHASTRSGQPAAAHLEARELADLAGLGDSDLEDIPARRDRSKRRNSTGAAPTLPAAAIRLSDLAGHPRPLHSTPIRAPAGACTLSRLSLIPDAVSVLAIRTTGNGCISGTGGTVTGIVSVATLDRPLASVTRSRTTWLPAVENDVLITWLPGARTPLPARSHAKAVIGLLGSVELDASETGSRGCGEAGNQVKDADRSRGTCELRRRAMATG